ncbi:MAG TPA: diaminopimelate decarboxylase [Gemmatimonadaceae bacterium]|nr:diaminopimelate decarboxylase [Gemmatimonadaceae bacterium]
MRQGIHRRGIVGKGILGERSITKREAATQERNETRAGVGSRRGEGLRAEKVPLETIANEVGTPAYVYSAGAIREQYGKLQSSLASVNARLHYSVKANSSIAVLSLLRELGAGVDIVSGGELYRAMKAGFAGKDIVFSGVGKTEVEMEEALRADVLLVNVESEQEVHVLDTVAGRTGVKARVALRVNPEVLVETPHPYTRTGEKGMKFGIPFDEALAVAKVVAALPNLRLIGLDMHVGSQISQFAPYEVGLQRLLHLRREIEQATAIKLEYLDIGGGLAVTYDAAEQAVDVKQFGEVIAAIVGGSGLKIILEPGRFLVGNAGILLTRVLYRKRSGGKEFIITDAGMTDLLRPSHYNAFHRIDAVHPSDRTTVADVVGPICESGDFLALDRQIDDAQPGDLLAIQSTGAYGFVMASNYNSRPKPPEVLVDGDKFAVVTRRESYEDLVRTESVPVWRSAQ